MFVCRDAIQQHPSIFIHSSSCPVVLTEVPGGKSLGAGSSIMIDPLPVINETNHLSMTTYFSTRNKCASRTKKNRARRTTFPQISLHHKGGRQTTMNTNPIRGAPWSILSTFSKERSQPQRSKRVHRAVRQTLG